jgi:hypothetical protein
MEPRPLPFKSFPNHYSFIILTYDATWTRNWQHRKTNQWKWGNTTNSKFERWVLLYLVNYGPSSECSFVLNRWTQRIISSGIYSRVVRRNISPPPSGMNKLNNIPAWKQVTPACHVLSRWYLVKLFRPWRSRHVFPKRRLIFNGLHSVIPQKIVLFITTVLKTSYPTRWK